MYVKQFNWFLGVYILAIFIERTWQDYNIYKTIYKAFDLNQNENVFAFCLYK